MGRETTGSLFTRGKQKNYYLRWQHDGKVRVMRLTGDDDKPITRIKEAQKAAERLLALYRDANAAVRLGRVKADLETVEQRAQQTRRTVANQKCTVGKAMEAYIQADPEREGRRKDKDAMQKLAAWLKENRPDIRLLAEVGKDTAQQFLDDVAKTYSQSVAKETAVMCRRIFRVLIQAGRLDMEANPFAGVRLPKADGTTRKPFSAEELRLLLDRADGDMRSLIVLALNTGLRLKDCVMLRWSSVDLGHGVILVTPAKTARTSGARVKVGITPMLREELSARLAAREAGEEFVYPGQVRRYRSCQTSIGNEFRRLVRACGIEGAAEPEGAGRRRRPVRTFHSLRHNYVSMCAEAGVPLSMVRLVVGHAAERMSEHYLHMTDAAAREMAASLGVPCGGHEEDSPRARLARLSQSLTDSQATRLLEVAARMLAEEAAPSGGEAAPTE